MSLNDINYSEVTEIPGNFASVEQLSMIMTRYNLAKKYSINKNVLEVACGSGFALTYLASEANKVYACDIDFNLVNSARKYLGYNSKIEIVQGDAHFLPFDDLSMDTIVFFEAIYYLKDIQKFVKEVSRVLKPGGHIIISSVNVDWHGFNPSPYSQNYYNLLDLENIFNSRQFCEPISYFGYDNSVTYKNFIFSLIKILAVKFRLIPKTMAGKKLLKFIFNGKLSAIPHEIYEGLANVENLVPRDDVQLKNHKNYKQIYFITKKN